ncbi:hypothetical protein G9A89_020014 [Geosiphon pyriformis]|nr:hypothetical protein G9A89_020014 [Geosiphon pyriformis]
MISKIQFLVLLITAFALLLSVTNSTPISIKKRDGFTGRATYYNPALGACGVTNTDSDLICALNSPQWGAPVNPNVHGVCGKGIMVHGPAGSVRVVVQDRCMGCPWGGLDLSPAAFQQIGSLDAGHLEVSWEWEDGSGGFSGSYSSGSTTVTIPPQPTATAPAYTISASSSYKYSYAYSHTYTPTQKSVPTSAPTSIEKALEAFHKGDLSLYDLNNIAAGVPPSVSYSSRPKKNKSNSKKQKKSTKV